jgi:hypothetical protein
VRSGRPPMRLSSSPIKLVGAEHGSPSSVYHKAREDNVWEAGQENLGKIFRTDNVGIPMVVRHRVFRPGYSRKHYPRPLRSC